MQPTINTFHRHLRRHALPHLGDAQAAEYGAAFVLLAMLGLEPARPILERSISPLGRRPRDQVAMLRCVLLMALLGEARFNAWGKRMKREPILAAMAGFAPDSPPGIGTLYDFMYRVLDGRPLPDSSWRRPSGAPPRGPGGVAVSCECEPSRGRGVLATRK